MVGQGSSLSILVDEKRVNDLLRQRSGLTAILREGCGVITFICFLALFTTMALAEPLYVHRSFEAYVHRRFDSQAAMPLAQVDSIEAFWLYMERSFLPAIYGNSTEKYTYPGYQLETFLPMDSAVDGVSAIRLLGAGALMRQIKIEPNMDCTIRETYEEGFPNCYGPYTPETVDTAEYGPTGEQGGKMFVWSNTSPLDVQAGKLATYEPGGFTTLLASNHTASVELIASFQEHDWLTRGTRAIFLDFTIYNFNLGLYCVGRIIFEVSLTGAWVVTFHTDVLRQRYLNPLGLGSDAELLLLTGEAVLVLFVFYYFVEECKEFAGVEQWKGIYIPKVKLDYFSDVWNVLDLSNLAVIVITLSFRIRTWSLASGVMVHMGDPASQTVDTFTDFSRIALFTRYVRSLLAFNSTLIWFKAVKYINIFPYISLFFDTITAGQNKFLSWFSLMFAISFGFVLAFCSAFGEQHLAFQTPFQATIFMMRVHLGDADLSSLRIAAAPWLGPAFIIMFVITSVLVLMNIFYSIMVSAVSIAREQEMIQRKKVQQAKDKAQQLVNSLSQQFKVEQRFRLAFPGLYSRMNTARKKHMEREQERDMALAKKEARSKAFSRDELGPGSPNYGYRRKHVEKSADDDDVLDEGSDAGSEPDLGPLRSLQQLRGIDDGVLSQPPGSPKNSGGVPISAAAAAKAEEEIEKKAVEKMLEATKHVSEGIVQRTREARNILFSEMQEAELVLHGIGNAMEVLRRRAADLDMQQQQLLLSL